MGYTALIIHSFFIVISIAHSSHNRTIVRECFKGDEASQWKRPKFDHLATPKPLNRSSQKLAGVITSWTAPGMQNFVAIDSGVSVPQIRDFGVTSFLFVFLGSSIRLQPTPLDGYLRKMRQMTSFRVRKCLLGVPITIFYIWTLKFSKNRHFGDRF